MKKSPLCGLSSAEPENGPWRRHNEGPQQTLADFFLSGAVIQISPQPSKNSLSSPSPSNQSLAVFQEKPFFGRANHQNTKSSLSLVQFFFLPLSLTSALKDFKLQGSLSSSHGRKLSTTGGWDSVSTTEDRRTRDFLFRNAYSSNPSQLCCMMHMMNMRNTNCQ